MEVNVKSLLQATSLFKSSYERIRENEEKFNIFSILYKEHDERRLHSRFISSLLDPKGSHGCGYAFLNLFIDTFELKAINFSKAVVYPDEESKKEFKNIDILIIDRFSKHAIIVENKIFASDSNSEKGGQLERYFKIIRDDEGIPSENTRTLYLTLDGHPPSEQSLGEFSTLENINGQCSSYDKQITDWLNKCKAIVSEKPFIRESIFQYEKLIKNMTNNQTTIEEGAQLKNLIGESQNNLEAAKYLFDNFKHIKWHAITDFWNELEEELRKVGFNILQSVNKDSIHQIAHSHLNSKSEEGGLKFSTTKGLIAYIWHEPYCDLWWGLLKSENSTWPQLLAGLHNHSYFEVHDDILHRYVELENGTRLNLKNFSQANTFSLISNESRKKIISKIVSDISNVLG